MYRVPNWKNVYASASTEYAINLLGWPCNRSSKRIRNPTNAKAAADKKAEIMLNQK